MTLDLRRLIAATQSQTALMHVILFLGVERVKEWWRYFRMRHSLLLALALLWPPRVFDRPQLHTSARIQDEN